MKPPVNGFNHINPEKSFENWAMTTFEIKKSSTKSSGPKVPKLMLGCNLHNSMHWALNSTNSLKKTKKKKLKGYEKNTKSKELKIH